MTFGSTVILVALTRTIRYMYVCNKVCGIVNWFWQHLDFLKLAPTLSRILPSTYTYVEMFAVDWFSLVPRLYRVQAEPGNKARTDFRVVHRLVYIREKKKRKNVSATGLRTRHATHWRIFCGASFFAKCKVNSLQNFQRIIMVCVLGKGQRLADAPHRDSTSSPRGVSDLWSFWSEDSKDIRTKGPHKRMFWIVNI